MAMMNSLQNSVKLTQANTATYTGYTYSFAYQLTLEHKLRNIAGVNVQYACMHVLDENHTHASYPAFPAFV